ncbi:MAG: acetate/propionate family kinase [Candidatus Acidulodesulfobacterium sp.]
MRTENLKIISVNSGSSSIKFSVFNLSEDSAYSNSKNGISPLNNIDRVLSCRIEEIGTEYGSFYLKEKNKTENEKRNFSDHETALKFILQKIGFIDGSNEDIRKEAAESFDTDDNILVAHRYVHGGKDYVKPLIAGGEDVKKLAGLNEIAPLHNPSNLKGLEVMKSLIPYAPQICIFDTAFHAGVPDYAAFYPIPIEYYEKFGIKKYGFHGISYAFIVNLFNIYNKYKYGDKSAIKKTVICHLGNGASVCAVDNGKSVDTSMGYTPLEGLMMGTRCGNIDPEVPFILKKKLNSTDDDVNKILNKKSGLLGISKKTYDFKELTEFDDEYSKLALKMYAYRIVKFIGQYAAVLNGIDALVFTGGIGENSDMLRKKVCENLTYLGLKLDGEKNEAAAKYFQSHNPFGRINIDESVKPISDEASSVKVFAVHTDEELQMAYESLNLLNNLSDL